jgi:hypothetical protein
MSNPEQLLARFRIENYPPVLDEECQALLRRYFQERSMELFAGCSPPLGGQELTVRQIAEYTRYMSPRARTKITSSVVGPHLLGDYYLPGGVGFWLPQHELS